MRHRNPIILKLCSLAALAVLLVIGSAIANAQSQAPATKPAVAAINSTANPTANSAGNEDIRDIRPPIHIPYGWLWAAYAGGGLAVLLAMFALWRWYRRHGGARRKLLYELTLEKLEAARALMEPLKGYQFSIAVSEIIRTYIEQRFQVRAAHRTTEEFLHDLTGGSHDVLTVYEPLLSEFLEHCDLAKFARWHLSVTQMEAMYQAARTFVIETGQPANQPANGSPRAQVQSILSQPRLT
jgi:hypothetical protein